MTRVQHKKRCLKSVVEIVTNIQKLQYEVILFAFYGEGNYELSKERLNYRVSKGAWLKMSEKDRDYYKKLITGVKQEHTLFNDLRRKFTRRTKKLFHEAR